MINLSKEWIAENGKLLKNAYSYAIVHKYDIKSERDVNFQSLDSLNPKVFLD